MKLCWSKECCIVFTYLVNFWWRLFTPLTDTVNLSCCGPPCGREQVLLITACVAGGFLVCVFLTLTLRTLTAARKLNRGRNRKRWRRGRGEKAVRKTACNQPLEIFETAFAFWTQGAAVLPTEFQPVSWCQIPSGYKLQKSTVGWNVAYLIYVRSKKIFNLSIWNVKKKFWSSKTPKNNSKKQARCCFWTKNISEKGENLRCTFISENNSLRCLISWEICVCSTWFIARIFRRQKVLRF